MIYPLDRTYPLFEQPGPGVQMGTGDAVARGGIPYNGLFGEAPPEKATFFRLQVYERVGI